MTRTFGIYCKIEQTSNYATIMRRQWYMYWIIGQSRVQISLCILSSYTTLRWCISFAFCTRNHKLWLSSEIYFVSKLWLHVFLHDTFFFLVAIALDHAEEWKVCDDLYFFVILNGVFFKYALCSTFFNFKSISIKNNLNMCPSSALLGGR